ncbi:MAG TPA: ornithine cyclodeaminase family protein [Steroidobacteraceae bacterium]|nr:ornithine cyclodeaminase family protein [Steroidobacteraceae bacterium]
MTAAHAPGAVRFYGPQDVRAALDYDGCIAAVRHAMADFSADVRPQPLRSIVEIGPAKLFGLMPGALAAPQGFGAKVLSVFADPAQPGRSAHRGVVVLFERDSGELSCIADAGEVTAIRTAAASAVATDALARRDARTLAIFGCGTQAAAHIRALARVRRLERILVWGRSAEGARVFAQGMQEEVGIAVAAVAEGREAAARADIICTVTASRTAVLFGQWVRPGTHVNAVGSSHPGPVEIDHALLQACRYIVDSRQSALSAASEFLLAKEAGLIDDAHIVAEIGEVLLGRVPGRQSAEQITLYKSLGHIVQDLAAVSYLHSRAGAGN